MMLSDDVDYCGELDGNCAKDDDNDDDDDGRKMDGTYVKNDDDDDNEMLRLTLGDLRNLGQRGSEQLKGDWWDLRSTR